MTRIQAFQAMSRFANKVQQFDGVISTIQLYRSKTGDYETIDLTNSDFVLNERFQTKWTAFSRDEFPVTFQQFKDEVTAHFNQKTA